MGAKTQPITAHKVYTTLKNGLGCCCLARPDIPTDESGNDAREHLIPNRIDERMKAYSTVI